MKRTGDSLRLSATDLANHLACHHLSHLDLAAARGSRRPPDWFSPDVAILRQRGSDHEEAFLGHLERQGLRITRLDADPDEGRSFERTLSAMRDGPDVIVQATLIQERWSGRADVLRRVPRPSRLGDWSYEVWDTKLARETKGGAVLQICLYSDLLEAIQGARPEHMYIVPPRVGFNPDAYRVDDFMAYYRLVRRRLEAVIQAAGSTPSYPEPVPHCDVCRWWPECDSQWRRDDHLSLVAGITRLQTREFEARDLTTLEALASEPLPFSWKPTRGALEAYARAREQARVQRDGRRAGRAIYELLPPQPGRGFERLPAPSPGDIFFDLEGDPFVGEAGREYLFGWVTEESGEDPSYQSRWALQPVEERAAFEAFVDVVMTRWARHPDLHVYHFAPYEPSAIKRLMGRYATRENEVDRMLRAGLLVDLHAVVRQTLRASVEEYSLKKLEALYGYTRAADLRDAGVMLRVVQRALELEEPGAIDAEVRRVVQAYNRDDCLSTLWLYRWLEGVRAEQEAARGAAIPRPAPEEGLPSESIAERDREVRAVMDALLDSTPPARADRSDEQQARWLLAYLLDWHRREDKAGWWEFFRLQELSDEALLDEKAAIAGLRFVERVQGVGGRPVDRYRFPTQETSIRTGDKLRLPLPADHEFGQVDSIDLGAHTIDVRKRGGCDQVHPTSVFSQENVPTKELAASLLRLGRWVATNGIDAPGKHRAARDLLLGRPPRVVGHAGGSLRANRENGVTAARRLVMSLERGTLAIQGPPGTGKTFTGARMICDLVRAGRKIGVCATSHKVIRNLLDKVVEAAKQENVSPRCCHKAPEAGEPSDGGIAEVTDNAKALHALKSGAARVLGGTAWLWSREEFFEAVDVLFVDEAGQMSLANVLAIAQCARSMVLLGDPRQLDQPLQGSHPEGTDLSALEHLLQGRKTIADDRGLFLEETWRLHPAICALTSELFYDGRLHARPGLERQAILGPVPIAGAGLWFLPVRHDGNQSSSPEEVETVASLVGRLTAGDVRWRDRGGDEHSLELDDILIIAPYNAQVADLSARLPGARVGTVDRFQGREAPVVVYSMTTSSPADAPHGMEFLYSLNRFNVATSRARCACVVVGNPLLFEPECQTPRQMQLANAFCRYLELAQELRPGEIRRPQAAPGGTARAAEPFQHRFPFES